MKVFRLILITLAAAFFVTVSATGCATARGTAHGMGQDLENAGDAIQDTVH